MNMSSADRVAGHRGAARPQGASGPVDSRSRLLDAASELMVERDSVDISTADIAKRAQLNTQLIRYYFGNKEGMLVALLRRVAEAALADLDNLVTSAIPAMQKIELHIGGIIKVYFQYPYTTRLLHVLVREDSSRSTAEVARFFVTPLVTAQTKLIEQCVAAGLMQPVDPMFFYFSVVGACDFIFASQSALRDVFRIDRVDDELRKQYTSFVIKLFMHGLKNLPQSSPAITGT